MSHNYFLKGQQFAHTILNENINTGYSINRELMKGIPQQSWIHNPINSNSQKSPNPTKPNLRESYDNAKLKFKHGYTHVNPNRSPSPTPVNPNRSPNLAKYQSYEITRY